MNLDDYREISPPGEIRAIEKLAGSLKGRTFLHVNSTASGGGVAELLQRMVPLFKDLDINVNWRVIAGGEAFFDVTKNFHNALQGKGRPMTERMLEVYEETSVKNADIIDPDADCVFIHDPQPAPLINYKKKGVWVWRCHIDMSSPDAAVWRFLKGFVERYDAAVFSVTSFAQNMEIPQFMISPSIDPLSEKNRELTDKEIADSMERLGIPMDKPIILQVSRFDPWKDQPGVIDAFRMLKKYKDCRLVLAGGTAADDPEGASVLAQVQEKVGDDPDIHLLSLPPGRDTDINAMQRAAAIILQKSLREGFGLTVAEAMWKGKPVIGGAVGGIPLQIIDGGTGFLVHSVEGAAYRMRQFLSNPEMSERMGRLGKEHIRRNFLITRHIRDYLSLWTALEHKSERVIYV